MSRARNSPACPVRMRQKAACNSSRHLTPELIWRDRWMDHANKAVALTELRSGECGAGGDGGAAPLTGLVIEPREAGASCCASGWRGRGGAARAGDGDARLRPRPRICRRRCRASPSRICPSLAGFFVRTSDGNAAVRKLLGHLPLVELPGGEFDGARLARPASAASASFCSEHARAIGRSLRLYQDAARRPALDAFHARFLGARGLAFDVGCHVGDRAGSFRRCGRARRHDGAQPRLARALRA